MTDRAIHDAKTGARRDRRSGLDRRRADAGPSSGRDRRVCVEPRKPDVLELQVSIEEWNALQAQAEARHRQAGSRQVPADTRKPAA